MTSANRTNATHPLGTPLVYLREHYLYEIFMLREVFKLLGSVQEGVIKNALIESFCLHARTLCDFFKQAGRPDDVQAAHFISTGQFTGQATSQLPNDIRERMNKQVAHLTKARENPFKKFDLTDVSALMTAIESDHSAFKNAVDQEYSSCFANEQPVSCTTISVQKANDATNMPQFAATEGAPSPTGVRATQADQATKGNTNP